MLPEPKDTADDDGMMMDHVALEVINAIHAKDTAAFRDGFHVLVADILNDLSDEMEKPE